MKYIIVWLLLVVSVAYAASPQQGTYDSEIKIRMEFDNVYNSLQDRSFKIFRSTPAISEMRNGEIVIYSSGSTKFMVRVDTQIFNVSFST